MLWPYDIYLALKCFEQFCSGQSRMQLFASSIIHLYFLIVLWFRKNPSIIFFDAGKQKKSRTQDQYCVGNTPKEAKKATDFEYSSTLILQYFITIMKLRKQQKVVARFRILFRVIQL